MNANIERYCELGWKIIRLFGTKEEGVCTCHRGASCDNTGKHPYGAEWQNAFSDDPDTIYGWLEAGSNIGILEGRVSNVVDVEIDSPEAEELWNGLGIEAWTPTYQAGRGAHRLFQFSDELPEITVAKPGGLEVRIGNAGLACQSVLPPSRHYSGKVYQWLPGLSPDDVEPMPLPAALIEMVRDYKPTAGGIGVRTGRAADILTTGAGEGERNHKLFSYCIKLLHEVNLAIVEDDRLEAIFATVTSVNASKCKPPLPDREVTAIFESAIKCARRTQDAEAAKYGILGGQLSDNEKRAIESGQTKVEKWRTDAQQARHELDQIEADIETALDELAAVDATIPEDVRQKHHLWYGRDNAERRGKYNAAKDRVKRLETARKKAKRRIEESEEKKERWTQRLEEKKEKISERATDRGGDGRTSLGSLDDAVRDFFEGQGLVYNGTGFDRGDWSLRIIKSDPPTYALRVPAWSQLLEGIGGELTLQPDEFMSAAKVANKVMNATGEISLDIFGNSIWERIWIGKARKKSIQHGLRAQLLLGERRVDEPADSEQRRFIVVARHIYDQLSLASQPNSADEPDSSGRPQWRTDNTLWFSWTAVWEQASKFRPYKEQDLRLFQKRILARCGMESFDNRSHKSKYSGARTYCVWRRDREWRALEGLLTDVLSENVSDVGCDKQTSETAAEEVGWQLGD